MIFLGVPNKNEYDQKIAALETNIKQAESSLRSYLDSKADQSARRELGFLGRIFSSPKPILSPLLQLSSQVREVYTQAILLASEVENDGQINQGSLDKARLVLRSLKLQTLITTTHKAVREKQDRGEALGVRGWFCNIDEGAISKNTALQFANEIKQWGALPSCEGMLNVPSELPREVLSPRGLSSLSVNAMIRGGGFFGVLAVATKYPLRTLSGVAFLSIPFAFPKVRQHIPTLQTELLKTCEAVQELTLAVGEIVQDAGETLMNVKCLSDSPHVIEGSILKSEARGRLYSEIAINVGIASMSTLAIAGAGYLAYSKDGFKIPDLGIHKLISSLNPMPLIEESRDFGMKQIQETTSSLSDLLESSVKQIQDILTNSLAGLESAQKVVLARIGL